MATLFQRGDVWYLNWREAGRQCRLSIGKIDAREAEKIRSKKEAQLTLGIAPEKPSLSVAEIIDDYCDWQFNERGTKKRRYELKHARRTLGHHYADSMPPRAIEEHKLERLKVAKPETVGKEIRILKAALQRALDLEMIKRNPAAKVKAPRGVTSKAVPYFTKAQLEKLYKADKESAPLWRFLANTGLRRAEFAKAKRSDVHGDVIRVESTEEGRTKSARWREVPLNAQAKAALKLLGKKELTDLAADTLSHRFARTVKAAGIDGHLHMLRHTFCSHLVMAGVSLRTVQVLAGHSSYSITERYAHLAPENKAKAVNLIRL